MSSDPVIPDSKELESWLRELNPAATDAAFLARLEAAADGSLLVLNPEEMRFEASLREIRPAPLTPAMLATLEGVVARVPFPAEVKIVQFPVNGPVRASKHRSRSGGIFAAAAAVAIMGAVSALLIPTNGTPDQSVAGNGGSASPPRSQVTSRLPLAPATFNRGLSEAADEGVIWLSGKPHRRVRVEYMDRLTLKRPDGQTYEVEQPRVEYILVPVKVD